jgi:hypothetical protein
MCKCWNRRNEWDWIKTWVYGPRESEDGVIVGLALFRRDELMIAWGSSLYDCAVMPIAGDSEEMKREVLSMESAGLDEKVVYCNWSRDPQRRDICNGRALEE